MTTYTASVTGPGALTERFEVLLDVLGDATLVGSLDTPTSTLIFDVNAPSPDQAVEAAYFRAYDIIRDAEVTFTVMRSRYVEGRESWFRRALTRGPLTKAR